MKDKHKRNPKQCLRHKTKLENFKRDRISPLIVFRDQENGGDDGSDHIPADHIEQVSAKLKLRIQLNIPCNPKQVANAKMITENVTPTAQKIAFAPFLT